MNDFYPLQAACNQLSAHERRSSLILQRLQVVCAFVFIPIAIFFIWTGPAERPAWLNTVIAGVIWTVPYVALDTYFLKRRVARIAKLMREMAEQLDRQGRGEAGPP